MTPRLSPLLALVALAWATVATALMLKPSQDPFYIPPSGFEKAAVGTILRERPVAVLGVSGLAGKSYQLLYRTTDAEGKPLATVTTVIKPNKVAPGPPRILAAAAAEDSVSIDCAPSYTLSNTLLDPLDAAATLATTYPTVLAAVYQGWYVTVPDHEGPNATFIAGYAEGRAMLDGIRAILNHRKTIPDPSGAKAILLGYSGGGHASAWAAQLASTYGKGVPIIGAASGGVPVDLFATIKLLDGGLFAALGGMGLRGAANAYTELRDFLDSVLTPEGKRVFGDLSNGCLPEVVLRYPFKRFLSLTTLPDVLSHPTAKKYLDLNRLGADPATEVIRDFPMYWVHSESDEIVPYPPALSYYTDKCAKGANIHLSTTKISGHLTMGVFSVPLLIAWSKQAFDGTLDQPGCAAEHNLLLPVLNSAQNLELLGPDAVAALLNLLIVARKQQSRRRSFEVVRDDLDLTSRR